MSNEILGRESLANTPRSGSAYIVIGVATAKGRPTQIVGTNDHPDPAELQKIVAAHAVPAPRFSFRVVTYEGNKQIGLFEIPPDPNVPVMINHTYGVLQKGAVYLRRNTECVTGDQQDILRIVQWAKDSQREVEGPSRIPGSWEELYRLCDGFDQRRAYIAVLSHDTELTQDDWQAFASVGWHLVVDFNQETDTTGGYSKAGPELAKRRSLRLTALDDTVAAVGVGFSVWVAALGLSSRPSTVQSRTWRETWREWNQTKARVLARWTSEVARATEPQPTTAVVFGGEHSYVQSVCDMLDQAFGGRLVLVVATQQPSVYSAIIDKLNASRVAIRLTEVCAGLRDVRKSLPKTSEIELPKLEGGTALVPPERARWVEEELEIVHLGAGISPGNPTTELRDFLRGLPITWYGLNVRVDIDRSVTNNLETYSKRELTSRDTRRLNLFHWPGAGGSTVARRVAWNLHNEFPVLVARAIRPNSTIDRLQYIFSLTRLPVLVVVEASSASSEDMDRLYDEARSANVPAVFLRVERRAGSVTPGTSHYLDAMLHTPEAVALAARLAQEVPGRRPLLESLIKEEDRRRRIPFYFGLVAFERDFAGLESYVQTRVRAQTDPVLSVCWMAALAYHFAQQPVPLQLFGPLLRLPTSKVVLFTDVFAPPLSELFVELLERTIKPAHQLVAEELLTQLLGRGQAGRQNWRNTLADRAIDFARLCADHHTQPAGAITQLLRAVFIERHVEETPAGPWEGPFSALVAAIPATEGRQRVLEELTQLFPEEPHFWAHLGRFYSRVIQDHGKAHKAHDRASNLAQADPVLRHMAGMAWRAELYDTFDSASSGGGVTPDLEAHIQAAVREARLEFGEARRLDQRSEYNYISHIQMIERVLGQMANLKGFHEDVPGFLAIAGNLWYRELIDEAEELLSQLSQVRAGEPPSRFQQDVRSRLDKLYGEHAKAIQGWTNLLDQRDVYRPPVRRMIVRAYLSRRDHDWSKLTQRELERISELAGANLEEEPDSDQNLRLWFQTVRHTGEVSIERAAEELGYRRLRHPSIDTLYYLYILKVIQAEAGVLAMATEAQDIIRECAGVAEKLPQRTRSFEWLGNGTGWQTLVHVSSLGEWDSTKEFYSREHVLRRARGRISQINSRGSGEIELPTGLKAFFVPGRGLVPGGYLRGQDVGREVEFYLGFSYDGLKAWSVGDVQRS